MKHSSIKKLTKRYQKPWYSTESGHFFIAMLYLIITTTLTLLALWYYLTLTY